MKPIRFAFVGFGNIAKTHIVALKALPVIKKLPYVPVLDTLITRNPDANKAQAQASGFSHISSSLEDALGDRDIEVVDICTPNALHLDAIERSAQAYKAVYSEKPLTDTYENSRQSALSVERLPFTQVALVFRYHPAVMRIREALQHGVIGDVLQCSMSYLRSGYLNAARPVSWRLQGNLSGGGAITDLGVHVLDLIRHLLGEFQSINGEVNTFVKKRPADAQQSSWVDMALDDWAQMNFTLASGVQGVAEVSRIAWGSETFRVQIIGTKGSITCDLEKEYVPTIKLLDGSSPAIGQPSELQLVPDDKSTMGMAVDCHLGALNHFLHRIAGEDRWKQGLAPSFEDCLRAEQLIDIILRSNGK